MISFVFLELLFSAAKFRAMLLFMEHNLIS